MKGKTKPIKPSSVSQNLEQDLKLKSGMNKQTQN